MVLRYASFRFGPVVVAAAVACALALTGCSSSSDDQPVSVLSQTAATETPTGDPAQADTPSDTPSDSASESASASESTSEPSTRRPNATHRPSTTRRASTTRKASTTRRASTTRKATTTVRTTGTGTKSPTPTPTPLDPQLAGLVAAESTALKSATDVHVAGTVVIQGQKETVDLHLGADAEGTLTSPHGVLRVRRVGKDVFLNADAAFFTLNKHPELAAGYLDQWMPIDPADPAYAVLLKATQIATWTQLAASAPVAKGTPGVLVGGVDTVAVSGGTGPKGTTAFVPGQGAPLPVMLQSTDKVDQIAFDGWNTASPAVEKPTALKDEPDDALIDVPAFATETAGAFSKLWMTTPSAGL